MCKCRRAREAPGAFSVRGNLITSSRGRDGQEVDSWRVSVGVCSFFFFCFWCKAVSLWSSDAMGGESLLRGWRQEDSKTSLLLLSFHPSIPFCSLEEIHLDQNSASDNTKRFTGSMWKTASQAAKGFCVFCMHTWALVCIS